MSDRTVKVTLAIDSTGAVRALRTAGDESELAEHKLTGLDRSVKGIGKSFGGLKSIIGKGLGLVGAGGVAFGIADVVSKTKELAEETAKFHSISGIGVKSSFAYGRALAAEGINTEAAGSGFKYLAKNVQLAQRQQYGYDLATAKASSKGRVNTTLLGLQAQAFKELGVNLSSFNRLSEQGKLEEITKKFEAMTPSAKKSNLALQLFGRGGTTLLPVLEKNNLGLTHQLELVKKFYPTLKGGSKGLEELNEKSAESKMAWEGFEFTLGQKLIPTMTEVLSSFSKVTLEVERGTGPWGELGKGIEGAAKFGASLVDTLKEVAKFLGLSLGGQTLGGALAAFAGVKGAKKLAHPFGGKTASKVASKEAEKVAGKAGYLGPAGWALAGGAVLGGVVNEKLPNGLLGSPEEQSLHGLRSLLGGQLALHPGSQRGARFGGQAVNGGETGREAALVAKLIASLAPTNDTAEIHLHLDSVKVAEAMIHNPRARRALAEATTIYSLGMAARKGS